MAERFNTFVETYQKGPSSVRANDVDLVQDVQEAILACVPAFVHAMTPILTVLPNSPTSEQRNAMQQLSNSPEGSNMLAELAALREAIQSDMVKRIDMSMLQQELAVKNTECEQAKAELLRHSEDFDIERTRFRDEMNEARHKLAIKDKQLDALRDELLKRATVMDDEARETQRSHATIVSNLEASLSELKSQVISMEEIVKAQTVTGDSLRAQLVEAKERLATAEKERQAQAALIAEQQTSYQALHALMVKRQIEHVSGMVYASEIMFKMNHHYRISTCRRCKIYLDTKPHIVSSLRTASPHLRKKQRRLEGGS